MRFLTALVFIGIGLLLLWQVSDPSFITRLYNALLALPRGR